ncbi:MAG: YdeI/OmpD-associated family protein [Caldilineaceae bacterium]
METLCFTATIEILGVNPYVLVTAEQAQRLIPDWRKPMPVFAQVNGLPDPAWRINMMPVGDGSFYLYLDGTVRAASSTKVGDVVDVTVCFDETYTPGPMHPMPDWFYTPLTQNPDALRSWEALLPSRQKEILRYLDRLKSDEARQRNVDLALHVLVGNEGRFLGRAWKDGK